MNVLFALASLFFFEKCCHWLTPGTRTRTRYLFAVILFGLSPFFVCETLTNSPKLIFLAFLLAAVLFATRFWDFRKWRDAATANLFFWLAVWQKMPALAAWSPENFLKTGTEMSLPNLVWMLAPLGHPGFFLLLPLLFLLVKRTDFQLFAKKMLLVLLALCLLFVGGLPQIGLADLLPAYALVLLLFFPAWDRYISYGFYFLKKHWMLAALWAFAAVQLGFCIYFCGQK